MRHRSKKREKEYVLRREIVEQMLATHPYCQACAAFARFDGKVTFINNPATDIHEIVRRSQGGSILDNSNLLAVCRPCHNRIGNHPQLAFDLGLARHGWER
jgi:5-methylcytosine-specific restriction endonuclease McrA